MLDGAAHVHAPGNLPYHGTTASPVTDYIVTTTKAWSTTAHTCDAGNCRVRMQTARGTFEFAFDASGRRVSTWNAPGGSLSEALVYWGTQPVAFHTPPNGGYTHFKYQDWLGTERLRTYGTTPAVEGTFQSLPYGDGYNASGNDFDWYYFAGQDWDPECNSQHAQFRQYASTYGRWMSPDPYDGSYKSLNPQSFNRYSYAKNNPLGRRDQLGLDDGDDPCDDITCYIGPDPVGPEDPGNDGQCLANCTGYDPNPWDSPPSSDDPPVNSGNPFLLFLNASCYPGGSVAPNKGTKPCNDANNNRSRFFQQLPGLISVAQQLKVPTNFIVGLSSFESGWFDSHTSHSIISGGSLKVAATIYSSHRFWRGTHTLSAVLAPTFKVLRRRRPSSRGCKPRDTTPPTQTTTPF